MCGFVAVFDKEGNLGNRKKEIIKAGELLSHRGPDSSGSYFDPYVGLYFRRLSIIDLSEKGSQPFTSEKGDLVLVFNGEIYNYQELREELKSKGHHFQTTSDTEVLMKSFEEYGNDCVHSLRGMFAFVIWNKQTRTLTLIRDRFGIKPLYLYHDQKHTIVASEIKSILALEPRSRILDEKSAFKYIARTFSDDTNDTFFKNIKSVSPSTFVTIDQKSIKESRYWNLKHEANQKFDIELFKSVFRETISIHTRSDVPISATLSGGLDSTSIVGTIAKYVQLPEKLKTFSIIPPETFDESFWINKTVEYTGVDHEYIDVETILPARITKDILLAHDEPFQYSSCIYQYMLRQRIAEKKIKVLLVGEGADEVLAGYKRLLFSYLHALYGKLSLNEFLKIINKGKKLFNYDVNEKFIHDFISYEHILEKNGNGQENQAPFSLLNKELAQQYQDVINEPLYINSVNHSEENFFKLLQKHLFVRNLPFVLRMEDRNSMAKGIEVRVPYLDHKFVEMVFSHDMTEFMKGGENKSMLRRAMVDIIPLEVLSRKGKSNRPGSHTHLVYKLLKNNLKKVLKSKAIVESNFWRDDLLSLYLEDLEQNNSKRAEVWFRLYVFENWRRLYKV